MEVKRKLKHLSLIWSKQGFTLVELVIAMVVSLLALSAIYSTFQAQHHSYQYQSETTDMQQNIRAAIYYMQREIRMAGSNPFDTIPVFGITNADKDTITFTEDVRGINPANPPDGDANDPDENITYSFIDTDGDGTPDSIARNDINGGGGNQIVARNIDALDFVYLDGASPPNVLNPGGTAVPGANLGQIRSVEITIVARTNHPLLYGNKNTVSYVNQQGRQILPPQNDNVSRRRITTLVHSRNLGT